MGQVSAVEKTAAGPALVIDGVKYQLNSVLRVEMAPTTLADLPPAA
jgi:hypothetical protein